MNALNVKRGFWRISKYQSQSSGVSPYTSTPESAAYASSAAGLRGPGSTSGSSKAASVHRVNSDASYVASQGVGLGSEKVDWTGHHETLNGFTNSETLVELMSVEGKDK